MRIIGLLLIALAACAADPEAAQERASADLPVDVAAELAVLRAENAELRERLTDLQGTSAEAANCGDLVPAGGDHALSQTFRWGGREGTLSGRVRVVP